MLRRSAVARRSNPQIMAYYPEAANRGIEQERPYYMKQAPGNWFVGMEHDGATTGYHQGFSAKPLPFLTRFRYNVTEFGACPLEHRHPSYYKYVHWMECSRMRKLMTELHCEEAKNFYWMCVAVCWFTAWHCYRYAMYHRDHSLYGLTSMPTKNSLTMRRGEAYHPMDKPVFRYYQMCPELYFYSPHRDWVNMEVVANNPFYEQCKANGQYENLKREGGEPKAWASTGLGPVASLTPNWHHKWTAWADIGKHDDHH